MKKLMIGGAVLGALLAGALVSAPREAEASKAFTKVTDLKCAKCHTSEDEDKMSDKDLTACGTKSFDVLKKAGYKRTGKANDATQLMWAKKALKGFKCP